MEHDHETTLYYVQSPSTNPKTLQEELEEASRAFFSTILSHHFSSSSRTNCTTIYDDASLGEKSLIIVDAAGSDEDVDDDDGDEYYEIRRGGGWWKRSSCTYRDTDSWAWILIQISWRAMLSLWVALLVFYVITKPPSPKISIEIAGIEQFRLGEGVDRSGVSTKFLTCNCSIYLLIENKSKIFGLHIRPPAMDVSYGPLSFASSHGPKLYVEPGSTKLKLYVGARSRAMYGAGRSMEDKLESHEGLPLVVQVKLRSSFQVVWKLIKTKFHHRARCSVLLRRSYDKKHRTQVFNSSCIIT